MRDIGVRTYLLDLNFHHQSSLNMHGKSICKALYKFRLIPLKGLLHTMTTLRVIQKTSQPLFMVALVPKTQM
jgi:hypothetical protein